MVPFAPSPTSAESRVTLWYMEDNKWERDYIGEDLFRATFPNGRIVPYKRTWKKESIERLLDPDHVNVLSQLGLTIEPPLSCGRTKELLRLLKPAAAIFLSDESGGDGSWCMFKETAKAARVVFRQYAVPALAYNQKYTNLSNVHTIPAGWMAGAWGLENGARAGGQAPVKPATERSLKWSFVGQRKMKIDLGITAFGSLRPNYVHDVWNATGAMVAATYNDSVFVLQRRGNTHWDCLRHAEAAKAGAIPVVVAENRDIIDNTWRHYTGYMGKLPPFIFHTDWRKAREEAELLLKQPKTLLERQLAVRQWYDAVMRAARAALAAAVEQGPFEPTPEPPTPGPPPTPPPPPQGIRRNRRG